MLSRKQQKKIMKDLNKGEEIYLQIDSGRYQGSILLLDRIRNIYYWRSDDPTYKFLLFAPGLVRKLSMPASCLSVTDQDETHLTASPIIKKKQLLPRDFSNAPIEINDHLFGKGKLVKITAILPNNHIQTRCVKSIDKKENDKIRVHRTLKSFIKIEDPTQILLRM